MGIEIPAHSPAPNREAQCQSSGIGSIVVNFGLSTMLVPDFTNPKFLDLPIEKQLETLNAIDDFIIDSATEQQSNHELVEAARKIKERRSERLQKDIKRFDEDGQKLRDQFAALGPKIAAAQARFKTTKQDPYAGFATPDVV